DAGDVKEKVREWLHSSDADHRDKLLACGAHIVAELRLQVLKETEFSCSAGIAHNKMLAKLASGMNKPAQQTVVPFSSVMGLLQPLPIKKMKQLGGKLGTSLQIDLGANTVGDLLQFSEAKLQDHYGLNTGTWLWNIARGINGDEVEGRLLPKSHGSGKTFPGPRALKTIASSNDSDSHKKFPSKSCPLRYGTVKIQEDALNLFLAGLREYLGPYIKTRADQCNGWGITGLSVSARSESYSGSLPTETLRGCSREETMNTYAMHSLDQLEDARTMSNDEERCLLMTSTYREDPTCSPLKQQLPDGFTGEALPSSFSGDHLGTESSLILKQNELRSEISGEGTKLKHAMDGVKSQEQKKKTLKEKWLGLVVTFGSNRYMVVAGTNSRDSELQAVGTSSILRFFQGQASCSSPRQGRVNTAQEIKASQSLGSQTVGSSSPERIKAEFPLELLLTERKTLKGVPNLRQEERTTNAWSYKIDEIDPSVVNELPPEIQKEVQAWLRPHKRANTLKRVLLPLTTSHGLLLGILTSCLMLVKRREGDFSTFIQQAGMGAAGFEGNCFTARNSVLLELGLGWTTP
ncbi:hypothetical protein RJ640_019371, partial [Escallonia rubra]